MRWDRLRGPYGEDGFSLVEVLVAMALFGLVLAALTGALISSARSIGDQRLRTAATRVATDHLETLRAVPFDELDARAGLTTTTTPDGRAFSVDTAVTAIDPASGAPAAAGRVKQVTAVVSWESGGAGREVSYTTAVAAEEPAATASQAIGTISLFPSPATTDATGTPLQDLEVTVPLTGFTTGTLVHLSWTNAGTSAGAKTLTSTSGLNWRGTIAREQVAATLVNGRGDVPFTVSVGGLTASYTLAVQQATANPPAITGATIDRDPIVVGQPGSGPTCANRNRCQNTVDVTFTVTAAGLDASQDAVIVQFQLFDGTFVEVPLAPSADRWQLTVPARTTKFRTGSARAFRFTAIRTSDGAAATTTVSRDVVSA
ncbi:MAG: type IV pilus modification PilV family protein [Acidimicrobiales bacterium]